MVLGDLIFRSLWGSGFPAPLLVRLLEALDRYDPDWHACAAHALQRDVGAVYWVAVKELRLSYHNG